VPATAAATSTLVPTVTSGTLAIAEAEEVEAGVLLHLAEEGNGIADLLRHHQTALDVQTVDHLRALLRTLTRLELYDCGALRLPVPILQRLDKVNLKWIGEISAALLLCTAILHFYSTSLSNF